MKIVGVGCGPGMLTEEAIFAIRDAVLIYGSRRAIELAKAYISPSAEVREVKDFADLGDLPTHAVLLSTGDPMLSGLGRLGGTVVPGISSLQVAAARMRIPLERISIVDAHAADHEEAIRYATAEIARARVVFLLAEPAFSIAAFAAALEKMDPRMKIVVCENLGYPDERISVGTASSPPLSRSHLFSILAGDL